MAALSKTSSRTLLKALCGAALLALSAGVHATEVSGHVKLNDTTQTFPSDSLIRDAIGSNSSDIAAELRLNLDWRSGAWSVDMDWQAAVVHGDINELDAVLPPEVGAAFAAVPNDDRRLMRLTDVVSESGDAVVLHRLDRFALSWTGEKAVIRFGRQALTWGNGLFYAPMDLVNPFDPATIDTEYKIGDDMLYGQYLRENGDDIEAAIVFRRDAAGDVEADESTAAVKYHGFAGELEYDLLVADSYGDPVVGFGLRRGVGGAVLSGDFVVTDTDDDTVVQVAANVSYSWVAFGRNMSGAFEYHYNGFGQSNGRYGPAELAANPELFNRLARGQIFTLGRHYAAGSVLIEMTPLWTVTPILLANVEDPSALLQLSSTYSLSDNMTLLGSINVPVGPGGSEFGGIEAGLPGRRFSTGPSVFAQFAWYF